MARFKPDFSHYTLLDNARELCERHYRWLMWRIFFRKSYDIRKRAYKKLTDGYNYVFGVLWERFGDGTPIPWFYCNWSTKYATTVFHWEHRINGNDSYTYRLGGEEFDQTWQFYCWSTQEFLRIDVPLVDIAATAVVLILNPDATSSDTEKLIARWEEFAATSCEES